MKKVIFAVLILIIGNMPAEAIKVNGKEISCATIATDTIDAWKEYNEIKEEYFRLDLKYHQTGDKRIGEKLNKYHWKLQDANSKYKSVLWFDMKKCR